MDFSVAMLGLAGEVGAFAGGAFSAFLLTALPAALAGEAVTVFAAACL